jgi:hypothetical protein
MYSFKPKKCVSSSRLIGALRSFQMLLLGLLAVCATEALTVRAATTDDMQIYSGRFNNGWGDSWSWMPRYPTNSPAFTSNVVYVASNSIACVPSGNWQAWWLKAGTSVDTTIYTNLSFWINGGATGGQTVSVQGELNGSNSGLPSVQVTAQANTWKQITISLASLGVNNKSNLTGFQIGNQTSTQPFFIDDMRLVAAPAPTAVHVNVNANQTVRTVDSKVFSINQVAWDGSVNSAASVSILNNIGATCLRWPGGSWGDGYHWTNENMMAGDTSPRYWGSFSSDFIALATNIHSDAFIIVNYGTSTPEEAAYGVRLFNVTNHCNFKYWEVGNEIGGSWEWDFRYPPFATNDILNLPSLANKLKTPTNNVATYLRTQFSSDTLAKLDAYVANPSANNASNLRWALVSDLNNLIYNSSQSIYKPDTNRFAGVTFRSVTWTNLSLPIPPLGQDLNNRMVLEDAYPELAKITPEINLASNWPDVDLPHDAWTYAKRFTNYYAQMKAADPTIKVGALADVFEDGTQNYANHPVVNPRTGQTQTGWNPIMLTFLREANCIPDFLIVHDYGPTAGDTQDLLYPRGWSSHAASLRQQLTDYLGTAGTNVTLEVTENGMGGDKQSVSLPGGLFYADSLGQILQTEFNSRVWWDMHNGGGPVSNPDPAMYGWRKDGSGNYISDGGIVNGDGVGANGYPTYYVAKLLTRFAKGGDTVVSASSDYELLTTYAVKRTNGTLTLLVINKSCVSNLTANFNLSGYVPATNATVYSYGIPQDEAARTGVGSMDIAQTSLTGIQNSFSATFAPFSASVLVLNPSGAAPPEMNALYAFEGNAQDTSGSGNDGTPNALSYVTGKVGAQAAQFNGTSSYVSIPRSVQDDFTVMMWVKTTDTAGSAGAQWWSGKGLVDGEVGGGGADWGTAIVNGKFVLGVGSAGGDTTLASSVNINDGTWHHVAATRNNTSGAMAVYVDGVLRGSGTGPTGSRTFPPGLRIGSLQTGNNFLNGTLDDVRLYDRILTPGEIAALVAPPAAPTNLVAAIGDASVALSWSAESDAASYIVKRSTSGGSGYANIATNSSLTFTNTGLVNGTLYYFVVSSVNAAGEGTNSTEVSARPTSFLPTQLGVSATGNQLQLNWPTDHTGWQLQSQTNSLATGIGTNWTAIAGSAQTNQLTFPVNPAGGAVFFRLVRP